MATLVKSQKNKVSDKLAGPYSTIEEASLAKNGDLIKRFKKLNVKVVIEQ